jgi:alkylation response protein AidB-like acyl-CoA dehydrogenase
VHVLGGVGFTLESEVQLYLRRVAALTTFQGGSDEHLLAIADGLEEG